MTLTQIEYTLALAREGHFGRAAQACCVSQPTLSAQIQKLEQELGVTLFDRSRSPIAPTKIGHRVLEQAKRGYSELKIIKEMVDETLNGVQGALELGVIPTLCPYLVPLFLKSLNKHYPGLTLNVSELTTQNCLEALENEQIDAALIATQESREKFVQDALYEEEMLLFANPDSPLLKSKKVSVRKIRIEDIWLLEEGHCLRDQVIKLCELRLKSSNLPGNLNFRSGNLESLRLLVRKDFGCTLLPWLSTLHLSPQEKQLLRSFSKPIPTRTLYLTQARINSKKNAVAALKSEVLTALAGVTPKAHHR